jgi:hypothetical protein
VTWETAVMFASLVLANAAISITITRSNLFERARDLTAGCPFLYDLVTCPYCFSHWVAFVMVAVWQPRFTDCGYVVIDLGISAFALIMLTGLVWGAFLKLTEE